MPNDDEQGVGEGGPLKRRRFVLDIPLEFASSNNSRLLLLLLSSSMMETEL